MVDTTILCPDGRLYSKYDQSPYVKTCMQLHVPDYESGKIAYNNFKEFQIIMGYSIIGIIAVVLIITFIVHKIKNKYDTKTNIP